MSAPTPDAPTRETILAIIEDIFLRRGAREYLGEPVTIAEHMLQAAHLAEQRGEDEAIVVAALLHDIGHFVGASAGFSMDDVEDRHHETAGAALLEPFFPPIVTDCVRRHVAAKRYLCATEPGYLATLSAASVHSLKLQGGPMDAGEVAAFDALPHRQAIVTVRRLDDAAKLPGLATPPFAHYRPLLHRALAAQPGQAPGA
jgi:[1-hydroxy-2-(trimethylamino)ethyl]phosphonate dioxygenase